MTVGKSLFTVITVPEMENTSLRQKRRMNRAERRQVTVHLILQRCCFGKELTALTATYWICILVSHHCTMSRFLIAINGKSSPFSPAVFYDSSALLQLFC